MKITEVAKKIGGMMARAEDFHPECPTCIERAAKVLASLDKNLTTSRELMLAITENGEDVAMLHHSTNRRGMAVLADYVARKLFDEGFTSMHVVVAEIQKCPARGCTDPNAQVVYGPRMYEYKLSRVN